MKGLGFKVATVLQAGHIIKIKPLLPSEPDGSGLIMSMLSIDLFMIGRMEL